MTMGKEAPEEKKTIRNHEECQHGGAYCEGRSDEARRIYDRDNTTGEYEVEWVNVEYWSCPQCGAAWEYEVD